MKLKLLLPIIFLLIFLGGCSASYKQLSKMENKEPKNFQEHLLSEYKKRASFEAEEMHDWNSAKLYSEKALKSLETDEIYPEEISYWKIPEENINEIKIAYDNLMTIYEDAKNIDPFNLARAISSLDCWSEQQEENWQTWDINSCKNDFLNAMHNIYEKISTQENEQETSDNKDNNLENETKDEVTIVTKNENKELMQIIYFDFDQFNLSEVSKDKIKKFLNNYGSDINEYLVVGHTDTKGTNKYNLSLSIKRAEVVKEILINYGINQSSIKILGKGEESLAVDTPDDTKQPANRRVEIKKTN
ncbi:OmpA family protein [Pelagibacteraceae bacterium]|nr:OmpA family protein [Pelagibacteraceae bacterium]